MDLVLIGRLMDMLENSRLDTLDVTEGGIRIRLSKTPTDTGDRERPAIQDAGSRAEDSAEADIAGLLALRSAGREEVVQAGLAGTFYRAPSPGAEPFAKEGERVEEGQTIGLIEAMKMLNPVEAPCAGTIARFLVDDAAAVSAGTALAVIDFSD